MSEESNDSSSNNNDSVTSTTTHSRRVKKDEIFGIPKDDLTLGIAGAAGLGVLGIAGKIVYDMMQNGQLPNPFAPNNPRISYSDVYEQQRAQQEWEQQQHQAQQVQAQPVQQQPAQVQGGDPNAQTMPALADYQGFDDTEDGVSYSTSPPKRNNNRFDRINGG